MRLLTLRLAFLVSTLYLMSCNSTKTDHTDSTTNKDTVLTVTQSKTIRQEQLPKSDSTFEKDSIDFSLGTFTAIPNEIDGCGCDFYLSEEDEKKEKYFFINISDSASIAFISINGKVEKFELTEHAENSNVYLYSNGTYHLKVEITKEKDSDYEYTVKEGLITVSKGSNEIRKRFIGGCGC